MTERAEHCYRCGVALPQHPTVLLVHGRIAEADPSTLSLCLSCTESFNRWLKRHPPPAANSGVGTWLPRSRRSVRRRFRQLTQSRFAILVVDYVLIAAAVVIAIVATIWHFTH